MTIKSYGGIIIITLLAITLGLTIGSAARRGSRAVFDTGEEIPLLTVMYHSFSSDISKCGKYVITPDTFEREAERATEFFRAAGVEDKISYRVHPHYHCIAKEDDGFDFMFKYIG